MNNPILETSISTGKSQLADLFAKFLPEQANSLKNGYDKIVDTIFYSTKAIAASTSVELIEPSDKPKVGITNIDGAKLGKDQYFLCTGMRLQTAAISVEDNAAITEEQLQKADFSGAINSIVANGEIGLQVNDKGALPRSSARTFATGNNAPRNGYFKLDSPILIKPQAIIKPMLYLPVSPDSATSKIAVRLELIGVQVVSA